jgi:hypothetical protein
MQPIHKGIHFAFDLVGIGAIDEVIGVRNPHDSRGWHSARGCTPLPVAGIY